MDVICELAHNKVLSNNFNFPLLKSFMCICSSINSDCFSPMLANICLILMSSIAQSVLGEWALLITK